MTTISIYDLNGAKLNARVDVQDAQIVLHSRSGDKANGRNSDYRLVLVLLIDRLQKKSIKFVTYLDSKPARDAYPVLQDRLLLTSAELATDPDVAAMQIIRKCNEGSRSNGAWRRILIQAEGVIDAALIEVIKSDGSELPPISAGDRSKVQRSHIEAAIEEIRQGSERPNRFENSREYSLIVGDGGEPLPPKKVFGLALAIALNRPVGPEHFSSGEVIFKTFRELGFQVVERVKMAPIVGEEASAFERDDIAPLPPCDEELGAMEGSKRLSLHFRTERSSALPRRYKQEFKALNGRLICFRCSKDYIAEYGVEFADACFDVHHIEMLSEREISTLTSVDQLELLCSNCHRVTHRQMKLKLAN